LKQNNLPFFTPAVLVKNRRRYDDIIKFNGIGVLDFDHVHNADELKYHIFENFDFVIAAWLSPSKKGVKVIYKIPVCESVDQFKSYFWGLEKVFEVYDGFDSSSQNCVLPLFYSYDYDLLYRTDAETWTGTSENPRRHQTPGRIIKPNYSDKTNVILKIAETGINKITGNGHPQLRSICLSLGGYVASGYINKYEIISHVEYLIDINGYLQKGPEGYKQTARWAIENGMKQPLQLTK